MCTLSLNYFAYKSKYLFNLRLLLRLKFSKNAAFGGFGPRPHCTQYIGYYYKKNAHCMKLNFDRLHALA